MADPIRVDAVSRRTVLKGMAGAAGLVSIPAIIAACSTPAASTGAECAARRAPSARQCAGAASARAPPPARVTFGSNYSNKDTDTKAMQAVVDAFTAKTGITVKVNTVDHNTFQDQINTYLQGTPDDVFTWFAGYRMQFFADRASRPPIERRVGEDRARTTPRRSRPRRRATTASSTSSRSTTTRGSSSTARASSRRRATPSRRRGTSSRPWATKMQTDGLTPLAFGDKDGWPAMGTFDILNMRLNGYDFHVGLMAGAAEVDRPEGHGRLRRSGGAPPVSRQEGCARPDLAGRRQHCSSRRRPGMYFLGTFAGQQATDDTADHADLDFFPFPTLGTEFDAELGIDAPIDGFMMTAKSPNLAADRTPPRRSSSTCVHGPRPRSRSSTPARTAWPPATTPTPAATTTFQKKSAEIIGGSGAIAQFLDRDTRSGLRRAERHAGLPADLPDRPEPGPRPPISEDHPGLLGFAPPHQLRHVS